MAGNSGEIKVESGSIEVAISQLNDLTVRLNALEIGTDYVEGDSGYVKDAVEEYDRTITVVIAQLKTLIYYTKGFLQKANNTFIEADQKISEGIN